MFEPLTLAILKAITTACVKYYFSSMMVGGPLAHSKAELGYAVPRWYMNPSMFSSGFNAYGTSVKGDEFESLEDAKQQAFQQMIKHIRLSNKQIVKEQVKYDNANVKLLRLVDLFVRGEDLEDFIVQNAKLDKQQLVKVTRPSEDIRAFIRIHLDKDKYIEYQTEELHKLKIRLTKQKTEDILAEMEADIQEMKAGTPDEEPAPEKTPEVQPPARASVKAGGGFSELEAEMEEDKDGAKDAW